MARRSPTKPSLWEQICDILQDAGVRPCLCFFCRHQPAFGACRWCWCHNGAAIITRPDRLLAEHATTDCRCDRCRWGCFNQPGIFAPGEAMNAAELLGMPFATFKRRFLRVYGYRAEVGSAREDQQRPTKPMQDVAAYVPRKVTEDPDGSMLPFDAPFWPGRCVFLLGDGRCGIHEAKPAECRRSYSCTTIPANRGHAIRDGVLQEWIDAGNPLMPKGGLPQATESEMLFAMIGHLHALRLRMAGKDGVDAQPESKV